MADGPSVEQQLEALAKEVTTLKDLRSSLRGQRDLNALAIGYAKRENTQPKATTELKASENDQLQRTIEAKDVYLKLLSARDKLSRHVPLPRSTIEKRLQHLFKSLTRTEGPSSAHTLSAEQSMVAEFFEFQELHRNVEQLEVANRELIEQRSTLQSNVAALNKEQRLTRREEQKVQRALDAALDSARALRREIGGRRRSKATTVTIESSETLMAKFKSGDALSIDEMQAMLEHSSLFQDPNPTEMGDEDSEA